MSKIFVVENYFPQKEYNLICQNVLQLDFTPPPIGNRKAVERTSQLVGLGDGGAYWFQEKIPLESDVAVACYNSLKPKFFFTRPKVLQDIYYTIVSSQKQFAPHVDRGGKYQVLIYLMGNETMNNGTGFYKPDGKGNLVLNTHIGFQPNRAILFTKDNYHAPLLWAGNSSMRYSICFSFDLE